MAGGCMWLEYMLRRQWAKAAAGEGRHSREFIGVKKYW